MSSIPPRLILASGSPRRAELLRERGYDFEVLAPDPSIEEGLCSNCGPAELVHKLALQKGAHVAELLTAQERTEPWVLLAADTVAECQGQILGKPANESHAREMLRLMRGRPHRVLTGICIWPGPGAGNAEDGPRLPHLEVVVTKLAMDSLSDEAIEEYLQTGQWEEKAGGFGYQDRLGWIHIIEGSESNVVGLPMERVSEILEESGVFTRAAG